jgi:flavin reductase (DIM6/NTAB) family NADH-FMN oxidoreductase RutF
MTLINESHHHKGTPRPGGRPQPAVATMPGAREMRQIFGRFATGITVITTGNQTPRGMTANAFTSVSIEPPLILVCIQRNATMHDMIQECGFFAVSVLAAHQEGVARMFADRSRIREQEFEAVDAIQGACTGVPVLAGALAWVECRLTSVYDGGDHSIFLGEVQSLGRSETDDALLFYQGGFHRLESGVLVPSTTAA